MANVELSAKLDKTNIEFGAEASLAKYETGIDFPIPFTIMIYILEGQLHLDKLVVQ